MNISLEELNDQVYRKKVVLDWNGAKPVRSGPRANDLFFAAVRRGINAKGWTVEVEYDGQGQPGELVTVTIIDDDHFMWPGKADTDVEALTKALRSMD